MAERHPREAALRRVHGTGALFAAAYGNVGSSIYYALGVVAVYGLGLTPVTFVIAGIIFAFTAATYTEATVLYPEAGGSSSFARHAFNELVSFFAAWAQMLTYIVTIAISAFFVPDYLSAVWEPLGDTPLDLFISIALVSALALLNVRGTKESARINLVLAVADVLTSALLIALGFALVFNADLLVAQVELGVAPTWPDFLLAIAVGMVAYTGIETISNMAEEARDFARTVPRGIAAVVGVVIGIYGLLPLVALSAMPVSEGADGEHTTALATTYKDNPVLGITDNLGLSEGLTNALGIYVGVFAAIILLIATNAALIGVSRLTFSMGQYRQLPELIRRVHPRYKTPYVAILTFAAIASITMLPNQATFMATLYAFGATLSFTIAHASVIRLRKLRPLDERPPDRDGNPTWYSRGNIRIRGVKVPLSALLGGFGTLTAFLVAVALDPVILAVGGAWSVLGMAGYVLYRRRRGLPLRGTIKVEALESLGVEEVEYESVLVVIDEDAFSDELVATALSLTRKRRRAIHILALLEVPTHLPLDAFLPEKESEAQGRIERAKLICGRRVSGQVQRVRPGQAGSAIIERAKELKAAAIVMQLRYRNGTPRYGSTLRTVLANRPTRVIVAATPEDAREAAPLPVR